MSATPAPTVLLLHELPDGTTHVDWMLAQDAEGERPLVTFRLTARLDDLVPGATLDAERIGEHRPAYLDYEGPVSGDRGRVTRLARGLIRAWSQDDPAWRLEIAWPCDDAGMRRQVVTVAPGTGAACTIRCEFTGMIDATP